MKEFNDCECMGKGCNICELKQKHIIETETRLQAAEREAMRYRAQRDALLAAVNAFIANYEDDESTYSELVRTVLRIEKDKNK